MSFSIEPTMIQVIAQSMGIPSLSDQAAQALAPDVEYRLREIIQEATKFMRHSKRDVLTTVDVDNALRLRNVEPLYGFGNKNPARFVQAAGHPDVFYLQDRELTTDQVVESPLPQCPVEIGVMTHWLVVNGVQPDIPENAPLERKQRKRTRAKGAETETGVGQAGVASALLRPSADKPPSGAQVVGPAAPAGKAGAKAKEAQAEEVQVRVPVKHDVTKENQMYLQRVQAILLSAGKPSGAEDLSDLEDTPSAREAKAKAERERRKVLRGVFASLACDPGLDQLLPYLRFFITEKVAASLKDLSMLSVLLKAARCLLCNQHLDIEPHLVHFMPAIMTCLVAQRLGPKDGALADHWTLRRQAADLIAMVCRRYGASYPNLQTRITKQLHNALVAGNKSVNALYGAVVGLSALGPRVTQLLVLPNISSIMQRIDKALTSGPMGKAGMEARHLCSALQEAAGLCMRSRVIEAMDGAPPLPRETATAASAKASGPESQLEGSWREGSDLGRDLEAVHDLFGESLLPFVPTAPVASLFL